MKYKEYRQSNYDYLAHYVEGTKGDTGEITGLMNATIAQFLQSVKREINLIGRENDGYLNGSDLVRIMIAELRRCVVDLEVILNTDKEVIQ